MAERSLLKRAAKFGAEVGVVGATAGMIGIAGITAENHRDLTHRSLKLHPALKWFFKKEQASIGIDGPLPWAATHRIHHHWSDMTGKTFYDIYHGMMALEEGAFEGQGINVPNTIRGLDPFVEAFTLTEAMQIGKLADNYVRERLGDSYQEPKPSADRLRQLFSGEPAYYYPEPHKRGEPYTQDIKERILLTDPHSPALIGPPRENGVHGIILGNIPRYSQAADLFRKHPELLPPDLRPEDDFLGKAGTTEKVAGFLVPAAILFAWRGEYTPKGAAKALVGGAIANGIRVGMEIFGGNITNSLGHAGTLTDRELVRAISEGRYKPVVNDDGSVTTDTEDSGLPGKILSIMTLDEVGGQAEHHGYPDKIAYTGATGLKAWREAPWGMVLETLADAKWFPLVERGEGFGVPRDQRPDMPNPALAMVHEIRAAQKAGTRKVT